jgi:hypothetical protein
VLWISFGACVHVLSSRCRSSLSLKISRFSCFKQSACAKLQRVSSRFYLILTYNKVNAIFYVALVFISAALPRREFLIFTFDASQQTRKYRATPTTTLQPYTSPSTNNHKRIIDPSFCDHAYQTTTHRLAAQGQKQPYQLDAFYSDSCWRCSNWHKVHDV